MNGSWPFGRGGWQGSRQLVWLRTDLRVADNTALLAAMRSGPTVALYLLTPGQWRSHDDAPAKVDFWLRNLAQLADGLRQLNVPLLVRQTDDWQGVPEIVGELCRRYEFGGVHVNTEYGIHESQRDAAVLQQLAGSGVAWHAHMDQLLFSPGEILTGAGGFFKVFSQFRKVCHQRMYRAMPAVQAPPPPQAPLDIPGDLVPDRVEGYELPAESLRQYWPAGETHALQRLDSFAQERLAVYDQRRDFPAVPGTSQLSPYLAAGVLSPRQCLHAALQANEGEFEQGNAGALSWIGELLWREFYKHVLVGFPQVSRHRAFKPETERLPWRQVPDELLAWQQGRTGFPIVDAAMRQLVHTGWMHNRLRMVVAMFLTKNMLIDWREGERFFMQHLIDGDLAANNGGWQWSASTGTDAVPWFRLFNPVSQSQRFDPDGSFIRHWVPELARVDKRVIHDPEVMGGLFGMQGYPAPIVDLAQSRARALDAFRQLGEPRDAT